jgi:branched-chain amino acid aminotransferase
MKGKIAGLFETMKWEKGKLRLKELHFERLFKGLRMLEADIPEGFTPSMISSEIHKKCEEKGFDNARVRLTVVFDDEQTGFSIDTDQFDSSSEFEKDLKIDIYPFATKKCGDYSILKSLPFTPYAEAAEYSKKNDLSDCIILNDHERVADSSISNLFIIKDKLLLTPGLAEGCVEGVMRKYLLEQFPSWGYECSEASLTIEDLLNADEIFLTNSLRCIRSVRQLREVTYNNVISEQIADTLREAL